MTAREIGEVGNVIRVQEPFVEQRFRANQVGDSGEGGKTLIRRVAVSGGTERQQLPLGAPAIGQKIQPTVRHRPNIANTIWPWKAGGVEQDSGGAFKLHKPASGSEGNRPREYSAMGSLLLRHLSPLQPLARWCTLAAPGYSCRSWKRSEEHTSELQ